ncbi:calmodulin-like isoform X2 [Cimex lectularius]|uniref:EF-hand domain-containing protein n=1 Tax=Cimex lectularius TaxID=79782 RepID=A0A8I6RIG5_CIMLE|nr:calmodulin-like isoform X2 [Cimex lectularius]
MSRFMRSRGKQTAVEKIQQLYKRPHRPPPPVHYLLSAKEVSENRKLFSYFDRNRDGLLDEKEYFDLINFETSNQTRYSNLENVFKSMDLNKDDRLSFSELLEYRTRKLKDPPMQHHLDVIFDSYDKNNDGRINLEELRVCWLQLGQDPTEPALRNWFVREDGDKDGLIDIFEFTNFVKKNFGKKPVK